MEQGGKMSSHDLSDEEPVVKLRMKPALSRLFCCSITAASGFIAAYALVAYAIALIYEIVWVVESQRGMPIPSALLIACYCIVIAATVVLVHGLISKKNIYLLTWLIAVILVLIPECGLVFYLAISHWGLQGVYGGAELACYVARLPAVVCGVVLVQSAYALREAREAGYPAGAGAGAGAAGGGSEFDASHYAPDGPSAFTNDAFLADNGKSGSMPDLRRHLGARLSTRHCAHPPPQPQPQPPPPPAYWQHLAERQLAASLRGPPRAPRAPLPYGTWLPRAPDHAYKRRHSVVGAFADEYPAEDYAAGDRDECKSEMAYPYYRYPYDPRFYGPEYDPRFYHEYREYTREEPAYGVNLLRHEPAPFSAARERALYGLRGSHASVGNESDDLTKYKDVAL